MCPIPKYLYKYLAPERLDVVTNGLIRLTPLSELNDPFDGIPYFHAKHAWMRERQVIENSQRKLVESYGYAPGSQEFEKVLEEVAVGDAISGNREHHGYWAEKQEQAWYSIKKRDEYCSDYGVLSLSAEVNNNLMWSHYGMNHQGFALKLRNRSNFLRVNASAGFVAGYVSPVQYSMERPNENTLRESPIQMMLRKSFHWEYEQEWRLIRKLSGARFTNKLSNGNLCHLFELPADIIDSVYIGCCASSELVFKILNELAVQNRYNHIPIFGFYRNGVDYTLSERPLFHSQHQWDEIRKTVPKIEFQRMYISSLNIIQSDFGKEPLIY